MNLTNHAYDVAKKAAQVWIPGLSTLYFALAQIWHLPAAEAVVGSLAAIDAFLGYILHLNTQAYNASTPVDGNLALEDTPDGTTTIRLTGLSTESVLSKPLLTFRVEGQTAPRE